MPTTTARLGEAVLGNMIVGDTGAPIVGPSHAILGQAVVGAMVLGQGIPLPPPPPPPH